MQEIVAGRAIFPDGFHHRRISAVADGFADGRFLAFELIPKPALGTGIITSRMPRLQPGQLWGRAIGAVKIGLAPGFRDDPGALRATVIRGS